MQSRVSGTKMLELPAPAPLRAKYPLNHRSLHSKVPRTAVLISVRNSEELGVVFNSGVLWIDLKEPRNGALGCASQEQVAEFLARYQELTADGESKSSAFKPRISIALGDLGDQVDLPLPPNLLQQFQMLKVGITSESLSDPSTASKLSLWQAASGVADRFVVVHYPDEAWQAEDCWQKLIEFAKKQAISRVLIDTQFKNGRSTLHYYSQELLRDLIDQANQFHIETMVAGSLQLSQLESVWQCGAKIIGFRSAVCQGNSRSEAIDTDRLGQLAELCVNDHF